MYTHYSAKLTEPYCPELRAIFQGFRMHGDVDDVRNGTSGCL